jgi:hypothetical protein
MGFGVLAICKCGYSKEFLIGGPMYSFVKTCYFPALCRDCGNIVRVNLLAQPPLCVECKSHNVTAYNQPELLGRRGKNVVTSWNMVEDASRVLELTDGDYLCPECGEYNLTFEDSGLRWD